MKTTRLAEQQKKVEMEVMGDERDDRLYKRDGFIHAYVDRRKLVEVLWYLDAVGRVRSMSDLVGTAIEILADILVQNGKVDRCELTRTALEVLEERLGNTARRGSGAGRTEISNLLVDEERLKVMRGQQATRLDRGVGRMAEQKKQHLSNQIAVEAIKSIKEVHGVDAAMKAANNYMEEMKKELEGEEDVDKKAAIREEIDRLEHTITMMTL